MPIQEHLNMLYEGVHTWNEWRLQESVIRPDLSEATLREADLTWANLRAAILRGADLISADMTEADLSEADLSEAHLRGASLRAANMDWAFLRGADLQCADLEGAMLSDANLSGADLSGADLAGAKLTGANLTGANFFGANLTGAVMLEAQVADTKFGNVDLSQVVGLSTLRHSGPSSVGIDTIYKSHGQMPEVFLRGAGVPEDFIGFVKSLEGKEQQMYACTISYAGKDQRFCDRLYADLQAQGIRTWYFPKHTRRSKEFFQEIQIYQRIFDKVIFVCSKHSLNPRSIAHEIDSNLKRERVEHKDVFYPVLLDDFLYSGWQHPHKRLVLERVAADFRGWQRSDNRYQQGLKKLVAALRINN
jgi:hypothetical protein